MEGEIKNLSCACSLILASLSYCYFIASKIPPGKMRLFSLLPIFYLFTILPYSLSSAFNTAVITFLTTWLSNFKLLLFCFNQGPLSSHPPKSFLFFISIAFLPIRIKPTTIENSPSPKPPKKLPLNLVTELLAFAILVRVLYYYKQGLHQNIILVLYCCLCFLLIDILIALSSAMVRALVGLELEPPSDEPYLSTSLQDFWGKRWNLTVTSTLRDTVYKPVRRFSAKFVGREWAPLPAVLAAFLVSGLMHELLFYNVTGANPTWEMTFFFALHGVCVVAEIGVKMSRVGQGQGQGQSELPWIVWTGLTVGFVVMTSFWLFFPPLIRNGADARVLQEIGLFVEFVRDKLHFVGQLCAAIIYFIY